MMFTHYPGFALIKAGSIALIKAGSRINFRADDSVLKESLALLLTA